MVAISLYRGNLHRVPEVPRRWKSLSPKISLVDFRRLLSRRSHALSRRLSLSNPNCKTPKSEPVEIVTNDVAEMGEIVVVKTEGADGNLNGLREAGRIEELREMGRVEGLRETGRIEGLREMGRIDGDVVGNGGDLIGGNLNGLREAGRVDGLRKAGRIDGDVAGRIEELREAGRTEELREAGRVDGLREMGRIDGDVAGNGGDLIGGKQLETTTDVVDALSETEKKKKEIEEKLEILNAKKHDLVQVLKQILNAEEELKRRSLTQGMGMRPSVPLQVDVTNDLGSLSRLTTPRLNSDGNLASDTERGEADDTSHQNTLSRHLVRPSSISPSSDSLHRRPAFSAVPHPRASLGGVGSPSRFAPVGHPANLPVTVATSGTSYIASSPSPAASGGTSAFRDNRQPSPWN